IRAEASTPLRLLDACSGDGRIGHAIARMLVEMGRDVELTFIEVEGAAIRRIPLGAGYTTVLRNEDFFERKPEPLFHMVVSNPPYLALTAGEAARLGLGWADAKLCGKNLYGLAIRQCVESCFEGGLAMLIAPHGWLRNVGY